MLIITQVVERCSKSAAVALSCSLVHMSSCVCPKALSDIIRPTNTVSCCDEIACFKTLQTINQSSRPCRAWPRLDLQVTHGFALNIPEYPCFPIVTDRTLPESRPVASQSLGRKIQKPCGTAVSLTASGRATVAGASRSDAIDGRHTSVAPRVHDVAHGSKLRCLLVLCVCNALSTSQA